MSTQTMQEFIDSMPAEDDIVGAAQRFFLRNNVPLTVEQMCRLITLLPCDDSRLSVVRAALRSMYVCIMPLSINASVQQVVNWALVVEVCKKMESDKGRSAVMALFFPKYVNAQTASSLLETFVTLSKRYNFFVDHVSYFEIWSDADAEQITSLFAGELKDKARDLLSWRRNLAASIPYSRPQNYVASPVSSAAPVPAPPVAPVWTPPTPPVWASCIAVANFDMSSLSGADSQAAEGSSAQCLACTENEKRVAMVPCGHMCLCIACAKQLPKPYTCPLCRCAISSALNVFY